MSLILLRRFSTQQLHASPTTPTLLQVLQSQFPKQDAPLIAQRLESLKSHHFQFLSMDVNWKMMDKEEQKKELEKVVELCKHGWHRMSEEQRNEVSLSDVALTKEKMTTLEWDSIVEKNEALQKGDWRKMTLEEKKAAYILAWGPKQIADTTAKWKIFGGVLTCVAAAFGCHKLLIMSGGDRKAPTMTKEWQEATNRMMQEKNMNPITGISSTGYKGKGQIQESNNIKE